MRDFPIVSCGSIFPKSAVDLLQRALSTERIAENEQEIKVIPLKPVQQSRKGRADNEEGRWVLLPGGATENGPHRSFRRARVFPIV